MQYSFAGNATTQQVMVRINEVFVQCIHLHWSHEKTINTLRDQIIKPLNLRTMSGKRKHTQYLQGWAMGYIQSRLFDIEENKTEFCYFIDDQWHSVIHESKTDRPTTERIYDANRGCELNDAPRARLWNNSDNVWY